MVANEERAASNAGVFLEYLGGQIEAQPHLCLGFGQCTQLGSRCQNGPCLRLSRQPADA